LAYILSKTEYAIKVSSLKDALKVIISSLAIVVLIKCYNNVNLILLIFACAFVYWGILYITKAFDEKDRLIVKSLLIGVNYPKYKK